MAKENKKELNKIEGINIPGLSKEKNDAVAKAIRYRKNFWERLYYDAWS